jgi:hypothetical protein
MPPVVTRASSIPFKWTVLGSQDTFAADRARSRRALDMAGRRPGLALFSLITAAYCSFVIWRIVQAVQSNSF